MIDLVDLRNNAASFGVDTTDYPDDYFLKLTTKLKAEALPQIKDRIRSGEDTLTAVIAYQKSGAALKVIYEASNECSGIKGKLSCSGTKQGFQSNMMLALLVVAYSGRS